MYTMTLENNLDVDVIKQTVASYSFMQYIEASPGKGKL